MCAQTTGDAPACPAADHPRRHRARPGYSLRAFPRWAEDPVAAGYPGGAGGLSSPTPRCRPDRAQNRSWRTWWISASRPAASQSQKFMRAGCQCGPPYNYAGAPFIGRSSRPLWHCNALPLHRSCWPGPRCWSLSWPVWALTSFAGACSAVGFWPAAIAACCYPLTGFFVLWQGYGAPHTVCWLPWILLAVDKTVRGAHALAPIALSVVTCLVLISGQLDFAAQVLLGSGFYSLWCLWMPTQDNVPAPGQKGRISTCGWLGPRIPPRRALYPAASGIHPHRGTHEPAQRGAKRSGHRSGWPRCPKPFCRICMGQANRQPALSARTRLKARPQRIPACSRHYWWRRWRGAAGATVDQLCSGLARVLR